MAAKLSTSLLLNISKSDANTINQFRLGAHLSQLSGQSIDKLAENACRDRFRFAQEILRRARTSLAPPTPQYRIGLARSYYAMYHAARAVVYLVQKGDDHEGHTELPKHIPKDFPDRGKWENELKNARLERNKADYDPYPKSDRAFASSAKATLQSADDFLKISKIYLSKKGCKP